MRRDSVRTSHYPCLSDGIRPKEDASEDSTTINRGTNLSIGDRSPYYSPDRCVTFLCIVASKPSPNGSRMLGARDASRLVFSPRSFPLLSIHAYTFNRE